MINRRRNKKNNKKTLLEAPNTKTIFFVFMREIKNSINSCWVFRRKQTHTLCLANTQTNSCKKNNRNEWQAIACSLLSTI